MAKKLIPREVCSTNSMTLNGTSLEVNKIRHSFCLGCHAQQKFAQSCLKEAREISALRSQLAYIFIRLICYRVRY